MWEPYYFWIRNYLEFDRGFKFEDYWSNTSECYYRMTNYTFIEKPEWRDYVDNDEHSRYDKVDTTTALISSTSEDLWYCTGMLRSWWEWVGEE